MKPHRLLRPASDTIVACRACGGKDITPVLDLGDTPLADRLLSIDQLDQPEFFAPLKLVFCPTCTLVQLTDTVSPEVLFGDDYPYFSSVSPALQEHFRQSAEHLIEMRGLNSASLVIEAASNDGYFLRHFVARNIPVLGIDPAKGPVSVAIKRGVNTQHTFFTIELARRLLARGKRADLIAANNVLAHVADLRGFVEGAALLLKEDGIIVIEVPYLFDLIEHCEFDTIYHQHLCYFSVTALKQLFQNHGLFLNDVMHTAIHGGSLRLFVEKHDRPRDAVQMLLEQEKKLGVHDTHFYLQFGSRVRRMTEELHELLSSIKKSGHRIVGYGAAAKACTLLNVAGIDSRFLDYLVDLNPVKHGRYMSGIRLPIYEPRKIREDRPDYLLILAWNFADEIMEQESSYRASGGKFIIPVPHLQVV